MLTILSFNFLYSTTKTFIFSFFVVEHKKVQHFLLNLFFDSDGHSSPGLLKDFWVSELIDLIGLLG